MTKLLTVSAALLLSVSVSQASLAQGRSDDKPGKGKGDGAEHAQGRDDQPGKGHGRDKAAEVKDRGRNDERARFDDAVLTIDPVGRTFSARLRVPGPVDAFASRWLLAEGLILTAVTVT